MTKRGNIFLIFGLLIIFSAIINVVYNLYEYKMAEDKSVSKEFISSDRVLGDIYISMEKYFPEDAIEMRSAFERTRSDEISHVFKNSYILTFFRDFMKKNGSFIYKSKDSIIIRIIEESLSTLKNYRDKPDICVIIIGDGLINLSYSNLREINSDLVSRFITIVEAMHDGKNNPKHRTLPSEEDHTLFQYEMLANGIEPEIMRRYYKEDLNDLEFCNLHIKIGEILNSGKKDYHERLRAFLVFKMFDK